MENQKQNNVTPFRCANCEADYGTTNGEWLRLEIAGLKAVVYKGLEFKCACNHIVKWCADKKRLLKKRK